MTLPTTGPLSFGDINVELGNSSSSTLSIGSTAARNLAGEPSGDVSISDFRGASATPPDTNTNFN